MFSTSMERTV